MRGVPQRAEATTGDALVKTGWLKGVIKLYLTPPRKPFDTCLVY